jgi:hypothetical protein
LTAQEQENIETALASQTSVSDAHNAMVFYLFADSVDAFSELSSAALAHLYFVKVQKKAASYDSMDMDEKRSWIISTTKAIRKYKKSKLIGALAEAVRVRLSAECTCHYFN